MKQPIEIWKDSSGLYRRSIIKNSTISFDKLKERFGKYKGLLIVEDNKRLYQGSILCTKEGKLLLKFA